MTLSQKRQSFKLHLLMHFWNEIK